MIGIATAVASGLLIGTWCGWHARRVALREREDGIADDRRRLYGTVLAAALQHGDASGVLLPGGTVHVTPARKDE